MRNNKFYKVLITVVFMASFISGCATVAGRGAKIPYQVTSINNIVYFALTDMCDREAVKWDYDPLSKIIILKKQAKEMKLLVGSKTALQGSVPYQLRGPVEIKDGAIYAPVDLWDYFQEAPKLVPVTGPVYLKAINSVVIDAGHGGKDPGAIGKYGLREKEVVLDVAGRVREELVRRGLNASVTRKDDKFVPLPQRSDIANEKKVDLFVSIHANANRSRWIEGFEVYYLTEAVDDDARALAAAEDVPLEVDGQYLHNQVLSLKAMLWDMVYTENRKESIELAHHICRSVSKKMNLKLLGVRGAPFAVLKGAKMPAVLVEIGYISNKDGERRLNNQQYRQKMAEAIVDGIIDFKNYSEGRTR